MAKRPKLSIVIPLKQTKAAHRDIERLDNCLSSLDAQTAAGDFEVIISDIDSDLTFRRQHEATAKQHKAKYTYAKTGRAWNINRARNGGIREARGVYVMITDADCIFEPNFIETVLKHAAPETIVHCRITDLPENYKSGLANWSVMRAVGSMRPAWCYGGCQVLERAWIEGVHGYDEKYELWGADDTDMMERAVISGKSQVWIESETAYYHQFHPKDNRTENPEQLAKNKTRLMMTQTRQLPLVRNPHEWGGKAERGEWDDTSVIVTTFMRDRSLLRTIQTIKKYYPTIDIIVADNGRPSPEKTRWINDYDLIYVAVPFDSGVTATRNAGVGALLPRHKLVVIVEDDICFTSETDLEKWRILLDHEPTAGVAGGRLKIVSDVSGEYEQKYEAALEINAADKTAYLREIAEPEWKTHRGIKYFMPDIVLNVFMARREVLEAHPWDENIKSAPEHCDWFFGLKYKTPWTVIYVPEVGLVHVKDLAGASDENYNAYRKRPGAFSYFASKWGVEYYWNSWNPKWGIENPQPLGTYAEISTQTRRNVFAPAVKILDHMGLKWWIEAGTCLGAIREKNFIGHDQDIDIGVWSDAPLAVADDLTVRMKAAGYELHRRWEYEGRLKEISFIKAEIKIDVFFFEERGGLAWHGAFGPDNENGTGDYTVFLPHVFTLSLFKDLREIDFVGLKVKVPNPPEKYLAERYGPDWPTPNKTYRYWTDCRAVARKFLSPASATVYIGGVWDVFHHGHLNILERCKALGRRLIVGVLTDDAAAAYKARPVIPENERVRIIRSLRIVDDVVVQTAQDPTADLKAADIRPDYLVHGDDWDFVPGSDYVRANGGMPIILPHTEGISSTLIKLGGDVRKVPRKHVSGEIEYAIGIKTFMRERTLTRTIQALQKNITSPFRLIICDDSGKKSDRKLAFYQDLRQHGAEIIDKPFDIGLSAGRNAIIRAVKEPYVLITDDDVMLDDQESLDKMRAILDARTDVGLVAAIVNREQGGAFASDAYVRGLRLERLGGLLKRTPMGGKYETVKLADGSDVLFLIADQVPNCFLARRELFGDIAWDPRIRIEYEHMDFFLQLKNGGKWKAAIAVEATATHFRSDPDMEYEKVRRSYSSAYFKQKHGIENIINQF